MSSVAGSIAQLVSRGDLDVYIVPMSNADLEKFHAERRAHVMALMRWRTPGEYNRHRAEYVALAKEHLAVQRELAAMHRRAAYAKVCRARAHFATYDAYVAGAESPEGEHPEELYIWDDFEDVYYPVDKADWDAVGTEAAVPYFSALQRLRDVETRMNHVGGARIWGGPPHLHCQHVPPPPPAPPQ